MPAGADFQNRVAAWVAVHILAEKAATPPWDLATGTMLDWLQCGAEQPVDDLLVATSAEGLVLAQVKRNLTLSPQADSDLASAFDQFVRQIIAHRDESRATALFSRGLDSTRDRFVLITSSASSERVRSRLRVVLNNVRHLPESQRAEQAASNEAERNTLSISRDHVARSWRNQLGSEPSEGELRDLLALVHVQELDVEADGAEERNARNLLRGTILQDPDSADQAWETLVSLCANLAAQRSRIDRRSLQRELLKRGFQLKAPRSYEKDITRLREFSATLLQTLTDHAGIRVGGSTVKIRRPATAALREAAEEGSVLVVGGPGAGKSGVVHDFVETLKSEGRDFVLLAVDHLAARSAGELRNEIGLEHDLSHVLSNWPGIQPAFLVIDALDAARAERAQSIVRELIAQIVREDGRWRVVASIRKFDLRYSERTKEFFAGSPPTELLDGEFTDVRHLNVPRFSDDELTQIQNQLPNLYDLIHSTSPQLKELIRTPFNLRLLAMLLGAEVSLNLESVFTTQLGLLDRFWQMQVIREDGQGDAREALLRETSEKMVEARALRINRAAVARIETSALLDGVLRHQILVEWQGSPGTAPDRSTLVFSHHVLFDYAVARLLLRGIPDAVVRCLRENPDFAILVRPSVVFHFHHLWGVDGSRREFWDLVFRVMRADGVSNIGKLIGPAAAADLVRTLADVGPLCTALADPQTVGHTAEEKALRHLFGALLADPALETRLVGPNASPWCELLEILSKSIGGQVAYTIRPLLWAVCDRYEKLTLAQKQASGLAARRLLDFAWSQDPRNGFLVRSSLQCVCRAFDSDTTSSAQILRRCLEPTHLSQHGFEEMPWLARELKGLAVFDPELVEDIYRAAFSYQETSTDPTTMISSRILPLTSNRRQDYGLGLYHFAKSFDDFLKLAPVNATRALIAAVEAHVAKYRHAGSEVTPADTFDFNESTARFHTDLSAIWDSRPVYDHEHPGELLEKFQHHLESLAEQPDGAADLRAILALLISENCSAALWNRTLRAAARKPVTLGRELLPLAWAVPILTCMDTTTSAGEFIRAIFPSLDPDQRERIERAILSIPDHVPGKHMEAGEHARNRLLGCLREIELVTPEGRLLLERLLAKDDLPANDPVFQIQTSWEPWDEEDHFHEEGVRVDADANRKIQELEIPIKRFGDQHLNSTPSPADIDTIFPALQVLGDAFAHANINDVHPRLRDNVWDTLAAACVRVARSRSLSADNEKGTLVRTVLLKASWCPEPIPDPATDVQFDEHPSWGRPAARIEAAEGLITLSRQRELLNLDVITAIERLSQDPVPAVRFQIARSISALYRTGTALMWCIVDRMCREERSYGVLQGLVLSIRRWLVKPESNRVAVLIETIFERIKADPRAREARSACVAVFADLFFFHDHNRCGQLLLELASNPAAHSTEILHLLGYFRSILKITEREQSDASQDERRRHAILIMNQALRSAQHALESLQRQFSSLPTDDWPSEKREEAKSLALILETTASEIYHASGAYEASNQRGGQAEPGATLEDAKRFYNETKPLLDQLADSSLASPAHHLVETLEFLVPADPRNVFLCLGRVIRTAQRDGYQFEFEAADLVAKLVERYLAEYRGVLLEDQECRSTLVEILDVFVEAGWPSALRLCYRLEEIFR